MKDAQKIKHLYARAGFGLSPQQYKHKSQYSLIRVVKELFKDSKTIKPLKIQSNIQPFIVFASSIKIEFLSL